MTANDRQQLRNNAIVAFISVVSASIVVDDVTMEGKASSEDFLETLDLALKHRLSRPDGAALAAPVGTLCDILRSMVRRSKAGFAMGGSIADLIDELFEDKNIDF